MLGKIIACGEIIGSFDPDTFQTAIVNTVNTLQREYPFGNIEILFSTTALKPQPLANSEFIYYSAMVNVREIIA